MTNIISIIDGEVVVIEGQPQKERFVAVRHDQHYEVFDEEYLAQAYLVRYGGKLYRLTYHHHDGSNGIEELPRSKFIKAVEGGE